MAEAEHVEIQQLCRSAFEAEHYRDFQKASDLHGQAIQRLSKLVEDSKFFDTEKKRIGRKQIKFHSSRRQLLGPILRGQKDAQEPVILPTRLSAMENAYESNNNHTAITIDQLALFEWENNKAKNPNLSPPPGIAPLLQTPPPFYTPTLSDQLPETVYHIYQSADGAFLKGGVWIYLKVKDATDRQTLYVLQAFKRRRYQIPSTTFHRSSEFTTPCIATVITPIRAGQNEYSDAQKGRPLTHHMALGPVIVEAPDRKESHAEWTPRRFTYGGRRFVWKLDERDWKQTTAEALYEVEKEWPHAGSKTGKRDDKVLGRKLAWVDLKSALKKVAVIHFAGGMDQIFRELLLASWLTRELVMISGHN